MAESSMRLFVAIPVPENVIDSLRIQAANLPLATNLHITLRFIGDAPSAKPFLEELKQIRSPAVPLETGKFFQIRKRIAAVRVELSPELINLKSSVDAALEKSGLMAEERKFMPHVTLSRKMSGKWKPDLQASWNADSFCLFQSILKATSAEHRVIGRFALDS